MKDIIKSSLLIIGIGVAGWVIGWSLGNAIVAAWKTYHQASVETTKGKTGSFIHVRDIDGAKWTVRTDSIGRITPGLGGDATNSLRVWLHDGMTIIIDQTNRPAIEKVLK